MRRRAAGPAGGPGPPGKGTSAPQPPAWTARRSTGIQGYPGTQNKKKLLTRWLELERTFIKTFVVVCAKQQQQPNKLLLLLLHLQLLFLFLLSSININEACLSVCLFGFGAQTTGWIPTKFGMGNLLASVGNLKISFWVDPQGGVQFWKNQNFPHMAQGGWRNPFTTPFAAPFEQLLEDVKQSIQIQIHFIFTVCFGKVGYFFIG